MFEKNLGQFLIMEDDAIIVAIFIAFNGFYSVLSSFKFICLVENDVALVQSFICMMFIPFIL